MAIEVDIADRLYDYTDEEKAAEVIADFQSETGFDDEAVLAVWNDASNPRRAELERRIFEAIDANGSAKRAAESIPNVISLFSANEEIPK